MKKILITGSRGYTDYVTFERRVDKYLSNLDKNEIEIVEGDAKGVDDMAREYAIKHNLRYKTFKADWDNNGKCAGLLRNEAMAEYCTHAIIFWDGESKGTANIISLIKEHSIPCIKVRVKSCQKLEIK